MSLPLHKIIALIIAYKYVIIFPIAVIEGPFLALLLGYLIYAGILDPFVTFIVLLIADIGPDFFYYRLGRYGNQKILESKYFSKSEHAANNLKILETMWHKHTKKTMFFGKLAYGISLPIIISAGMAKLPLRRFILTSLPVGIFQIAVLLAIGYHLGPSYELAASYVKYPAMILAVLIAIVVLLYICLAKYSAKIFTREKENYEYKN